MKTQVTAMRSKRFSFECGEVQKPKEATVPTRAAFDTLFLELSAPLSLIAMERRTAFFQSRLVSWNDSSLTVDP